MCSLCFVSPSDNQIRELLTQKKFASARALLEEQLAQAEDAQVLRVLLSVCAALQDNVALQHYLKRLSNLNPHDAALYFFTGVLNENQGDFPAAIKNYQMAFYMLPAQKEGFTRALRLVQKLGWENRYHKPADLVFYSGNYLLQPRFNPTTLKTRGLGGSESALIYITRELAKLGQKVLVFCNCDVPGVYDGVEYLPVEEFVFFHEINRYKKIFGERNPDAFLGDLNPHAYHAFCLHDAAVSEMYREFDFNRYRMDEIYVLSESHKKSWQDRFGVPDNRFYITRNGYDPELFFPVPNRRQQIIYASRPERGFREAVQVYQKLKLKFPELKFLACTYSSKNQLDDDPLLNEVRDLFGLDGVEFLGSLSKPEFASRLRESMLLIHPNVVAHTETSCIVAIEAQACGVPVVCGRGGAMAETVQHGRSGVVVDWEGDRDRLVDGLTRAVESMLVDENEYKKLSCGAAEWARDHYRWDRIAGEWLQHIQSRCAES